MRDNVRKNDERNPRHTRGSGDNASQKRASDNWITHFDVFQRIAKMYKFEKYDVDNLDVIREIAEALHENLNMSAISPVLPNSEELDKVNEVEHYLKRYPHLERCYFASDSTIVELRKFYSEIAYLQNEDEDVESAFEHGTTSLKKVIKALNSLRRLGLHSKKILIVIGIQPDKSLSSESSEIDEVDFSYLSEKQREKFCRITGKIHKSTLEAYKTICFVAETSWNYLPIEVQNALESLARRSLLYISELEKLSEELSQTYLSNRLDELANLYNVLVITVFSAVENSKDKPKLCLLRLFESWGFDCSASEQSLMASLAMTEIQELAGILVELPGVARVEAVIRTPGDLHRIDFRLVLSEHGDEDNRFYSTEDLWEVAARIAFRSHKRLRESTGQNWYFNVTLDEDFSDYPNSNRIVAVTHAESNHPY